MAEDNNIAYGNSNSVYNFVSTPSCKKPELKAKEDDECKVPPLQLGKLNSHFPTTITSTNQNKTSSLIICTQLEETVISPLTAPDQHTPVDGLHSKLHRDPFSTEKDDEAEANQTENDMKIVMNKFQPSVSSPSNVHSEVSSDLIKSKSTLH